MEDDARRRQAIGRFYKAYRELQRHDTLRMHSRSVLGGETLIEVWRYHGIEKGERIIKVSLEDEADAYEHAAGLVEDILQSVKRDLKEKGRSA